MDAAYVSALSALAGSVIGGLSSGLTTLVNQRAQSQAEQAAHDVVRREDPVETSSSPPPRPMATPS